MKKRFFIGLAVVLAVGLVIWYVSPIRIADADPADVGEIVIFNGNNGKLSLFDLCAQNLPVRMTDLTWTRPYT